ncbi:hypothetical protein D3C81_1664660 [compost metagenome]
MLARPQGRTVNCNRVGEAIFDRIIGGITWENLSTWIVRFAREHFDMHAQRTQLPNDIIDDEVLRVEILADHSNFQRGLRHTDLSFWAWRYRCCMKCPEPSR